MIRRTFFIVLLSCLLGAKNKKFTFKIKTKSGNIVGNVTITASDRDAANIKLEKRYPKCKVLSCKTD